MSYTREMRSDAVRLALPLVTIEYNGNPYGESSITFKGPVSREFKDRIIELIRDIAESREAG